MKKQKPVDIPLDKIVIDPEVFPTAVLQPGDWEKFSKEEKMALGRKLFQSGRGWFLLRQAIDTAVSVMKEKPYPYLELSNIRDMQILRETVFRNGDNDAGTD